jgi:hypothetical protein
MTGLGFLLLITACNTGCGKSASPAVVRIEGANIDRPTIRHWEQTIKLDTVATASSPRSRQSRREQALEILISADWLAGEAVREGLPISSNVVRQVAEPRAAVSKVFGNFTAAGLANPDAEFLARAVLAAQEIRRAIFNRLPAATEAEIAGYYAKHHRMLHREETRTVHLIEQLRSRSAALALARRLGTGQRFANSTGEETVNAQTPQEEKSNLDGGLVRAIFSASPHKLGGPVRYAGHWVIFVVQSVNHGPYILPAGATAVTEMLNKAHRQAALKAFFSRYQREWKAKTTCRAGFVVPDCSESHAQLPPAANPLNRIR